MRTQILSMIGVASILITGCLSDASPLFTTSSGVVVPDAGVDMGGNGGIGGDVSMSSSATGNGGTAGNGTGGQGGIGGDGTGGFVVATPCKTNDECPGAITECKRPGCVAGFCNVLYTQAGVNTSGQTSGDCKVKQCDGFGNVISVPYHDDIPPDDGQECSGEYCDMNGEPVYSPHTQGTLCTAPNGKPGLCSGIPGLWCVECIPGVHGCFGTKVCMNYKCI